MGYVGSNNSASADQTNIDVNRVETLIEFAKVCPFHSRRLKQSSPGFEGIMANEYQALGRQRKSIEPMVPSVSDQHLGELVEMVWGKIQERHRNTNSAFRFFDWKGKGKLDRASFVNGLEKLRVRLQASDIDAVWSYLDWQKRGFLTFNDFQLIANKPNFNTSTSPLAQDAQDPKIQDLLAQIRRQERDRIAQEMLESV